MRKTIVFAAIAAAIALPLAAGARVSSTADLLGSSTSSPMKGVKGAIARCPIIESKIQVKITGFDNSKMKNLNAYGSIKSRLTDAVDKLAARGVDVAALRIDLAALDTKIAKFSADYASYVADLKSSQEYVCGKAQGQFVSQLKSTKASLLIVAKDAADIRSYIETSVKADLAKVKVSLNPAASVTSTQATSTRPVKPTSTPELKKIKPLVPALPKLD